MGKFLVAVWVSQRAGRFAAGRALSIPYALSAIPSALLKGARRLWQSFAHGLPRQPLGGMAKRVIDIALAGTALLFLTPVMLVIAGLIRLLMGGPVIFRHGRIGHQGRPFVCYKFRTMACDADELLARHLAANPAAAREWRVNRKLAHDPRVTPLGHLLRKSSIDELPQLFNVLRGEMSLVGPRPIVPEEMVLYGRRIGVYLGVRPGITGLWQVCGRNSVSYRARIARDCYYVRHWSLKLDLALMLKTIPAVLKVDQTS
ncbi:MAG TPA: sugar transferase [Hyphomicrobiaceae bacterium]|nr:sugar transferase [Hyphomicrobiaceae bacterium]